jgi:hypothetical protein
MDVKVTPMAEHRRILELALKGLEVERSRINDEIRELESRVRGIAIGNTNSSPARILKKRRGITAAGRKRLSEIAKRRWAVSRKAGKATL